MVLNTNTTHNPLYAQAAAPPSRLAARPGSGMALADNGAPRKGSGNLCLRRAL